MDTSNAMWNTQWWIKHSVNTVVLAEALCREGKSISRVSILVRTKCCLNGSVQYADIYPKGGTILGLSVGLCRWQIGYSVVSVARSAHPDAEPMHNLCPCHHDHFVH